MGNLAQSGKKNTRQTNDAPRIELRVSKTQNNLVALLSLHLILNLGPASCNLY
ncbi:hypothetical protein Xen7305DRAFT_00052180 [Xenococcus sp. PCC 7305]|nr:hypothetical protein Xen7305DRAFT_00052180 [Xenococcus sp. PCC 7305]